MGKFAVKIISNVYDDDRENRAEIMVNEIMKLHFFKKFNKDGNLQINRMGFCVVETTFKLNELVKFTGNFIYTFYIFLDLMHGDLIKKMKLFK